jgi:PPM family protein phosphatase
MTRFAARGTGISETGRVRETNEDRILMLDDIGGGSALYAVADGLGGHAAGDVASDLAVATLRADIPQLLSQGIDPAEAVVRGLRHANEVIRTEAGAPDRRGMATTCTAVMITGSQAVVAHVGDSRAYLIRGRGIRQLTTDHTLVGEFVRRGSLDPKDAEDHAQRHVLTRALGAAEEVLLETESVALLAGDVLVLTSDGLYAAVSPEEIAGVVAGTRDPQEACAVLVGLANVRGGIDNISLVIVRVRPRWMGRAARLAAPLVVAALIGAGTGIYLVDHSYFLGAHEDRVAVMRGVPARLLGVPLFSVMRVTPVTMLRIAPAYRGLVLRGIPARSPEDAEAMLHDLLSRP